MKALFLRRGSAVLTVTILSAVAAAYATAQARRTTAPPAAPRQGTARQGTVDQSPHRGQIDMFLAQGVFLDNDNEIGLAKIAQTRAESKDLRTFAEKMIEDHEQFAKDLEKYAGPVANRQTRAADNDADGASVRPEPLAAENAARVKAGAAQPTQPAQPRAGGDRTGTNPQYDRLAEAFVQIHQEIAKECRESAQHELQSRKGTDFDKCFVGMQLGAHMKMIDVLKVFERHASPALAKVFEKGRDTAEHHFDRLKELMKDLDDGSNRRETASEK
jgi:predicted outer membrane protein